jgi:hypothetical protein
MTNEQRLSVPAAVKLMCDGLKISTHEAEIRLIEADAKGKIPVIIDQKAYTEYSTAIQQTQDNRAIEKTLGGQMAASSGFTNSGSYLDLLRDSANQGAIAQTAFIQCGTVNRNKFKRWLDSESKLKKALDAAVKVGSQAPQPSKPAATPGTKEHKYRNAGDAALIAKALKWVAKKGMTYSEAARQLAPLATGGDEQHRINRLRRLIPLALIGSAKHRQT